MTIRIHQRPPGSETGSLICAHCQLPHPVLPNIQEHYERLARLHGIPADRIWECGACYLAHAAYLCSGLPPMEKLQIRVDCTHPVPPFEGDT